MALEISYWTGADPVTRLIYGELISSESVTLGASTTDAGTIPTNAAIARVTAGENCRVSNNGAAVTATNGVYLAAGTSIDIKLPKSGVLKGMTA